MWFHTSGVVTSVVPLLLGFPRAAALPGPGDAAALLGIVCCSFWAQLLLSQGLQLLPASKAAAINYSQVGGSRAGAALLASHPPALSHSPGIPAAATDLPPPTCR